MQCPRIPLRTPKTYWKDMSKHSDSEKKKAYTYLLEGLRPQLWQLQQLQQLLLGGRNTRRSGPAPGKQQMLSLRSALSTVWIS
jgi:hypothetical protein